MTAGAKVELTVIDGLGSFTALDRQLEAICWTHRGEGWSVHDWRGAGRGQAVHTKREAERLVKQWARMEPAEEQS